MDFLKSLECEAMLSQILDASDEVISAMEADGTLVYCNQAFATAVGQEREKIIGTLVWDYFDPEVAAKRREHTDLCLKTGQIQCYDDMRAGNHWTAKIVPLPGDRVLVLARDVTRQKLTEQSRLEHSEMLEQQVSARTAELKQANRRLMHEIEERKKAQQKIKKTKDFLQIVVDEIPYPMAVKDREHRWILVNRVICEMFNKRLDDLLGKTDYDFIREEEADIFRAMEEQVFKTGEPNINEEVITEISGRKRWQVAQKSLITDPEGEQFLLAIAYDITDRRLAEQELRRHQVHLEDLVRERTAELNAAHEQLLHSQKLEAVGQLAGGMAHEFNNILAVALITAEVLLRSSELDQAARDKLRRIVTACNRAKSLTSKLLAFARKEKLDVHRTPLCDVIADVTGMLGATSKKIAIRAALADKDLEIVADANQIAQALLNLCINARDAMPQGGNLDIVVEKTALDEDFCKIRPALAPGEYCCITVRDTGSGIAPELHDKIFEPFFTTKERSKGTGLGLSVTLGIIRMHNGDITVQSVPGQGTSVQVYLPLTAIDLQDPSGDVSHGMVPPHQGTILIIDDELDFLDVVKEALENTGFSVLHSNNSKNGVVLFQNNMHAIDLVILDIMMPEMDGTEVFNAIRDIREDIRVIICSGYSVEGTVTDLLNAGAKAFVQKPCQFNELCNVIAEVIE